MERAAPFKILAIVGSASRDSSNHRLVARLQVLAGDSMCFQLHPDIAVLPPFDPELAVDGTPELVADLRQAIETADGVLISTPEYIFSIPARLKNLFEWCVASTVFSGKPAALITASASGLKGHDELQLIMKTLGARLSAGTSLLIQGVKAKVDPDGIISDPATAAALAALVKSFRQLIGSEE